MTHDELIEAAQHAFHFADENGCHIDACWLEAIRAIEPLIRADERAKENEACALAVEDVKIEDDDGFADADAYADGEVDMRSKACRAIRSRMGGE